MSVIGKSFSILRDDQINKITKSLKKLYLIKTSLHLN